MRNGRNVPSKGFRYFISVHGSFTHEIVQSRSVCAVIETRAICDTSSPPKHLLHCLFKKFEHWLVLVSYFLVPGIYLPVNLLSLSTFSSTSLLFFPFLFSSISSFNVILFLLDSNQLQYHFVLDCLFHDYVLFKIYPIKNMDLKVFRQWI